MTSKIKISWVSMSMAAPELATYRFLEDHIVNNYYWYAGEEATTRSISNPTPPDLPANWVPSPNVEPLTAPAVNAFYAAGPRDLGLVRVQWERRGFPRPVTYWYQVSPNLWALTGLGSDQGIYPPVPAVVFHPVGNIPQ